MSPPDTRAVEALRHDLDRARADLRAARDRLAGGRPEPGAYAQLRREVIRYELRVAALEGELNEARD